MIATDGLGEPAFFAFDLKSVKSPYVLYLRPFNEDRQEASFFSYSVFSHRTKEEQLEFAFRPFGQVVAVSDSRTAIPNLGAARGPLESEEWRNEIRQLIEGADLVVVRLGTTPGIIWETAAAVRYCPAPKLVVLVPNESVVYLEARQQLALYGVKALPEAYPEHATTGFWSELQRVRMGIGGLFIFGAEGEPIFRSLYLPAWKLSIRSPYTDVLRSALSPLFESSSIKSCSNSSVRMTWILFRAFEFFLAIYFGLVVGYWVRRWIGVQ